MYLKYVALKQLWGQIVTNATTSSLLEKVKSSYMQIIHTAVNIHSHIIITQNSVIELFLTYLSYCSNLLLLSAKRAQIVSFKECKNKNKKSAKPLQAFSKPGTIYITKFNNYEKLECSCFIILAKPRIKQRIISRWCPFLYRFFNSTFF